MHQAISECLEDKWKERTRLAPDDCERTVHFSSKAEYVEYIIELTNRMSGYEWAFFIRWCYEPSR